MSIPLFISVPHSIPFHSIIIAPKNTTKCDRSTNLQVDRGPEVLAGVDGILTKLLLDTEDLVELGQALATGRGTSLDLTSAETDNDVGDSDILCLTRSVGDHDAPAGGEGVLGGLDGLGEGTDLVDLEEEGVARLELDGLLDADGVGDGQVIADNLEVGGLVEVAPRLPVVLSEWVLDADDGVGLSKLLVEVGKLLVGDPLGGVAVGVLEVQIVLLGVLLVELAGRNVHGDLHPALVTGLLDGISDELKSLLGGLDIWCDTTLIADVSGGLAVLLDGEGLEGVVNLRSPAHTLGEGRCLRWDDHELLESETATSVGAGNLLAGVGCQGIVKLTLR
jgi:hypothetical protein